MGPVERLVRRLVNNEGGVSMHETLNKILEAFIWGGANLSERLPTRLIRFIGVIVAFVVMFATSPIWIPLAMLVGFMDLWRDLK